MHREQREINRCVLASMQEMFQSNVFPVAYEILSCLRGLTKEQEILPSCHPSLRSGSASPTNRVPTPQILRCAQDDRGCAQDDRVGYSSLFIQLHHTSVPLAYTTCKPHARSSNSDVSSAN